MLSVLNRELGADFDPDAFEHVAFWDDENLWIDIRLRSLPARWSRSPRSTCRSPSPAARRCGPRSRPSSRASGLEGIYAEAGLEMVDWWTDPDDLFALSLARGRVDYGRQRLDQLAEPVRRS